MPPKHLEEQLVAYIDNQLNEEEVSVIENELKQSAELRGLLSMLLRQQLMLAQKFASVKSAPDTSQRTEEEQKPVTVRTVRVKSKRTTKRRPKSGNRRKRNSPIMMYAMAAAAVLLAIVGYVFLNPSPQPSNDETPTVARENLKIDLPIIDAHSGSITWSKEHKVGDQLAGNESVLLHDGASLVLSYKDGSRLAFSGSNNFTVRNGKSISLTRGKVLAKVNKQQGQDTVSIGSAFGTTTVIGTEFTVTVNEDVMLTSVSEGTVKVEHRASRQSYTITEHQEIELNAKNAEQYKIGNIVDISNDRKGAFVVINHNGETIRFVPEWINPGPDMRVLEQLENYKAGQLVKIQWHDDGEHLRVINIELAE